MDAQFWHERWKTNVINFHQSKANPLLVSYFQDLSIEPGGCVFVPLCGKTLDITWLLSGGFKIIGVELSELAVRQLFENLGCTPQIKDLGTLKHYKSEGISIFVGDIFELTPHWVGSIDAVYDRAAFVAMNGDMRSKYSSHVIEITKTAPQLLITYAYDQALMEGPPFAIGKEEIERQYIDQYEIDLRAGVAVKGGLKGLKAVDENVWILNPRIPK